MKINSSQMIIGLFVAILLIIGIAPTEIHAAEKKKTISVPLTIQDSQGIDRTNSALSSGIPLPRSAKIKNTNSLRIVDEEGKGVPAQFTVLARWDGKPNNIHKPIKWVLVDFVVDDLGAHQKKVYRLLNTGKQPEFAHTLSIDKNSDVLTVHTGVADFVIDKKQFTLFDQVSLDQNGDGKIQESVLKEDGKGAVITQNDKKYSSKNTNSIEKIKVVRQGPLHSIVMVKGWHTNDAGKKLLAFTARLHFYAGSSAARVQYSIWNDEKMLNVNGQPDIKAFGSPHTIIFDDASLYLQLKNQQNVHYALGGTKKETWDGALTNSARIYQDSSGGPQWNHKPDNINNTFKGFKATANQNTLHDSCSNTADSADCRALGWADISSDGGGIAVGVRDFWQNYPKGLQVDSDGSLQVQLFPKQYTDTFELRVGEQKTHEVIYYFHGSQPNTEKLQRTMLDMESPLQAWAPAKWYLKKTGTFHKNVPYNKKLFPEYEGYNDAAISFKDANFLLIEDGIYNTNWLYGNRPESLGWRNYGDRIAEDETGSDTYPIFTNQQYDHPLFFITQLIRGLDRKKPYTQDWWRLAGPSALQQADIDIIHSRCTGKSEKKMQECMDPSNPYTIGWAMGGRLTNQWHAWSSIDIHRNALIDQWSGGIEGMLDYYYLTGDLVVRSGWKELAENSRWGVENTPCNTDPTATCGPGYVTANPHSKQDEWARDGAYNLEIMTDAWMATGDKKYFSAARALTKSLNPEGMWFASSDFALNSSAPQSGETLSPWGVAMVMKSLGYYLDSYKEQHGKIDRTAQNTLMQYAKVSMRLWQSGSSTPSQYRVFETGGFIPEEATPFNAMLADGLTWAAVDYNDGSLNKAEAMTIAKEAFENGSRPWGKGYAKDTFTSVKTQVVLGISGWRYPRFEVKHNK